MLSRYRWILFFAGALLTAGVGLYIGKTKERDFLGPMYARKDFTLMSAEGELFQLSKFSEKKLLLLVFLPDGLHPRLVKPFAEFAKRVGELKKLDVETMLVTRSNREVARNFVQASGARQTLLVDASGTVGRLLELWPPHGDTMQWGYALVDNKMRLYWSRKEEAPLSYGDLLAELKKLSASMQTSSASQ